MCKLKGLTEYQIADNASVSRLQRPRPENVLFQKQRAKKVPLFPTDVTVPKLHIDFVCRPKKYRPYRLTMSCGRRQRPPEVAR